MNTEQVTAFLSVTGDFLQEHFVGEYLATVLGAATVWYARRIHRRRYLRNEEVSRHSE
ncbi:hypothetical protein [Streptomyces sp. A1547]|uniref:hypothetical protein n=1 Tax=Streptomyces sp. A1547 TaxID=2563105 RepID=UPI00144A66BE|nr:hypothetical protein [Streptomyces sp. A1547]